MPSNPASIPGSITPAYAGALVDLTQYTLIFEDHFDQAVGSESISNNGVTRWQAPYFVTYSQADVLVNGAAPDLFTVDGASTLTLGLQVSGGRWKAGSMMSVHADGTGFSAGLGSYFECRIAMPVAATDPQDPYPHLGGWLRQKSKLDGGAALQTTVEIDYVEHYAADSLGAAYTQSLHLWPALTPQPGEVAAHVYDSKRIVPAVAPAGGGFIRYGCSIDDDWIRFFREGVETSRIATPVEAKASPFFMLFDNIVIDPADATGATARTAGTNFITSYPLQIDYARCYTRSQPATVSRQMMEAQQGEAAGTKAHLSAGHRFKTASPTWNS